jgi:hypothetical protein
MTLLDEVMQAHGGSRLRRESRHFTIHTSIDGDIIRRHKTPGVLKNVVISGSTRDQHVCITGFAQPDQRGIYWPDRVVARTIGGTTPETRDHPQAKFDRLPSEGSWDNPGSCPPAWCRSGVPGRRLLPCQAARDGMLTRGSSLSGAMVSSVI